MPLCAQTVSECLARFYATALDPEGMEATLGCFARAVGTGAAAIVDARADGSKIIRAGFGVAPEAIADYNMRYQSFDLALPCAGPAPEIFNAHLSGARWPAYPSSEFYNDWARPNDATQIASVTVEGADEALRSLLLIAGPGHPRFGEADHLAFLGLLRPHIQRVGRIAAELRRAERQAGRFLDILERLTQGAIVIDGEARVIHATAAAVEMLDRKSVV